MITLELNRSLDVAHRARIADRTIAVSAIAMARESNVLIALNTLLALGAGLDFGVGSLDLTVFDVIGLGIAGAMVAMLVGRAAGNLRELAAAEPAAPRRASRTSGDR